jgi:hypothetical protein
LYFGLTGLLAARKPLWTDEFFTLYAAQRPSVRDVWEALQESPDAMPVLTHVLTHCVGNLLGFSHLTVRLPAMVGYWLLCVAVFAFLRRRVALPLAAAGMLIPLTVAAVYPFAYEARGYGLLAGFAAAAVLCWDDVAASPRQSWWALPGISLCLAATVASHVYGVFVVVPLAVAELARTRERGRFDLGVWLAMACAGLVALPLAPFMPNMRRVGGLMAGSGSSGWDVLDACSAFLSTPVTYFGLLVVVGLVRRPGGGLREPPCPQPRVVRKSDWVLALAFASMPLWAYLATCPLTSVFRPRYFLPTVIGVSLLPPLVLEAWLGRGSRLCWAVPCWVLLAAAWNVADTKHNLRELSSLRQGQGPDYLLKIEDRLPHDDLPVVVSEHQGFTRLHHYAGELLRARLVYLPDDNSEWNKSQNALFLKQYGYRMQPAADFCRSHREFYLYVSDGRVSPFLTRLIVQGAELRDTGLNDTDDVYPRPGLLVKVKLTK